MLKMQKPTDKPKRLGGGRLAVLIASSAQLKQLERETGVFLDFLKSLEFKVEQKVSVNGVLIADMAIFLYPAIGEVVSPEVDIDPQSTALVLVICSDQVIRTELMYRQNQDARSQKSGGGKKTVKYLASFADAKTELINLETQIHPWVAEQPKEMEI